MATYTTDRTAAGAVAKYQEKGVFQDTATYEAAALAANDIVQMIQVAPGVTVLDMVLYNDDCGTCTADIGDGDDVDRFMDGVDIGAATGTGYRMGASVAAGTCFPKLYSTADTIDLKLATGPATGTLTLVVYMTAETTDLA